MLREIFGSYVLKDSALIGTATLNSHGEILTANTKLAKLLEAPIDALIGRKITEVLPNIQLDNSRAGTHEGSYLGATPSGKFLDLVFSFNNACMSDSAQDCCLFVIERSPSQTSTPSSVSFLMKSKSTAFVLIGDNDRILDINDKACRILKTRKSEALHNSLSALNVVIPYLSDPQAQQRLGQAEYIEHLEGKLYLDSGNRYLSINIDQIDEPGSSLWLYTIRDITDEKHQASSIRKNDKHFRNLFNHASDGIFINDAKGNFIDVNAAGCMLCGYTKSEIIGKNLRDFVEQLDEGPWLISEEDAQERSLQYRSVTKKDGSKIMVEVSVSEVNGVFQSIIRDVTKQKQAELTIKKREHLLREVGRIAKIGGWEYHLESQELILESGFTISKEISGSHTIPRNQWHSFFTEAGAEVFDHYLDECVNTQNSFSFEIELSKIGAPGTWIRIIGQPLIEQGKLVLIQGTMQDISEHKSARKAILKEKSLSEQLLNSLPGVFYLFTTEGQYKRWNQNLLDVSGYTDQEMLSLHPLQLFSEEEGPVIAERIANVFKTGEDFVEAELVSKDGTKTPYYFTGKAVEYDGEPCLMGVGTDISARKHFENLLEEANKQLNAAQSIAKLGYWEWNRQSKSVHWTKEMYNICGVDPTANPLQDKEFMDCVHPKDRKLISLTFDKVFKTQKSTSIEFAFKTSEGLKKHLKAQVIPYTADGMITKLEGTLQDISERTERELKLQESQQRFHLIAQTTNDALFEWNPLLNKAWWSDSHFQLFGFDPQLGVPSFASWLDKIHPDDRDMVVSSVDKFINGKMQSLKTEIRLPLGNGKNRILLLRCFVSTENQRFKIIGAFIDITHEKEHEEAIRLSNERYELIGKSTNDAIWDVNLSDGVITGNDQLYKLYGVKTDTHLTADDFFNRLHPDDVDKIKAREKKSTEEQRASISNEYRFRVGNEYRIILDRLYRIYDEDGTAVRSVGAMQDITEKKKAEIELQELSNRLLLATTSASLGIFDWDVEKDTLVWNEYMYDMFQLDPVTFDHSFQSWLNCFHPQDIKKFNQCTLLEDGAKHHLNKVIRTVHENEEVHYIETHAVLIKDENGNTKSVIGICKDVTEIMTSEQKIAKAIIQTQEEERMETGRELHDNIVQLLVASLINLNHAYGKLNGEAKLLDRALEYIQSAIEDTRKLSHQLAPSNINESSLDENIAKLIEDINTDDKFETSMTCKVDSDQVVPHEIKLNVYRIVQEQINNIIKHAKATRIDQSIKITPTLVEVTTEDNGVGFDPEAVSKGIGLNNISRRVKIFEGELEIETAPNKGCKMTIKIPIS
ncbi:PAS domain S-box protein [Marinoscillum furvescens]|uniref:histidine kinase n=1 Tax=Marinoscillum furvescens DSM 4134 TaxID=1122208 RepID=A0A3D9L139_MARFU|nr:PAS domain S-box protein [Marinoscillum furvescens]RED97465.1 PAS domain S-box-containing protein [Marinoscillum furvescens DSM 4134]